jgi:hypothetical protein
MLYQLVSKVLVCIKRILTGGRTQRRETEDKPAARVQWRLMGMTENADGGGEIPAVGIQVWDVERFLGW